MVIIEYRHCNNQIKNCKLIICFFLGHISHHIIESAVPQYAVMDIKGNPAHKVIKGFFFKSAKSANGNGFILALSC